MGDSDHISRRRALAAAGAAMAATPALAGTKPQKQKTILMSFCVLWLVKQNRAYTERPGHVAHFTSEADAKPVMDRLRLNGIEFKVRPVEMVDVGN